MTDLPISALLTKGAGRVAPQLASFVQRTRERRRAKAQALRLLRVDYADQYDFMLPRSHPFLDLETSHPDDLAAFSALADPALDFCLRHGLLEVSETLGTALRRNLVLIGSPEVERVTQLALGYRRLRTGGVSYEGDTLDLPYRWEEDPAGVRGTCRRFVPEYGWVERPNWPLIHEGTSRRSLIPETDNDGLLLTDWLLVTVTPNFLSTRSLEEGKHLVSIGGTHGVGTRALPLVLKDRACLTAIAEGVRDTTRAFQVVVQAHHLRHSAEGTVPRKVTLHDVVELGSGDATWEHARGRVAQRYTDWALEEFNRNLPDARLRR